MSIQLNRSGLDEAKKAEPSEGVGRQKIGMETKVPVKRRPVGKLLKLAVNLVLIAAVVWWLGGLGKIGAILAEVSFGLAAVAFILNTLGRALMTYKWVLLLKARNVAARFFPAMRIYCASMVWGVVIPTTAGADAIRAVSMIRKGFNTNDVLASIVIERLFGFLSALILGLCSLLLLYTGGFLDSRFTTLWWAALAMIFLAILVLLASFSEAVFHLVYNRFLGRFQNNRFVEKLRNFHETYRDYRNHKLILAIFTVYTFVEQLVRVVQVWLVAWALDVDVGILCFLIALPLTLLVSRVPVGIDGLGTYDVTFAVFLSLAGISAAGAVAIVFSNRVLQILSWLPWWFAHVVWTGSAHPPSLTVQRNPQSSR